MPKKLTQEQASENCKIRALKGGEGYTYPSMIYINATKKIAINCLVHGEFWQRYDSHVIRMDGCLRCSGRYRYNTREWVEMYTNKFGYRYSCDKVDYVDSRTKVTMVCKIHGDFNIRPSSLLNKQGCKKCAIALQIERATSNTQEFIAKANKIQRVGHYTYNNFTYIDSKALSFITCTRCRKDFLQTPNRHLSGEGCPSCASRCFDPDKPAILYYLEVNRPPFKTLYKIGITNKSINKRFNNIELSYITVITKCYYESGKECYEEEQKILKKFKKYQYKGPKVLKSGNTELFIIDITLLTNIERRNYETQQIPKNRSL